MKIRTLILLVIIPILMLTVIATVTVSVVNIQERGERDIAEYEEQELAKVKQNLKNFVDLAYESINANYQTTSSKEYLEKASGERLKNMVNIVYDVVKNNNRNAKDKKYLEKFYGHRLKNIIEVAQSILQENVDLVKSGKLTLEQAQQKAKDSINRIRYNNSGYIWINDTTLPYPKMLVHPVSPELNNTILDDPKYNCALGRQQNIFRAAVELCNKDGEGFIDYKWSKPAEDGKVIKDVPKISYVKIFKPWNWIMGVGIYVDDAVKDAQELTLEEIKSMRYDNGTGYFWVNDTTEPLPKMIMHPVHPEFDGNIMNLEAFNSVGPEKKNLFAEFLDVCKQKGEGFVFYNWYKKDSSGVKGEVQPKLTFVKEYKEWGWIIGTGIFLEDAIKNAKKQALESVQKMRYDNGEGYFWINDMGMPYPRMIMHSVSPELNGTELSDPKYNCALGNNTNLFRAMIEVCEKDGQGFVDYTWFKPTQNGMSETKEPKLSYVRLFTPWNWVVGTGVYIDHINATIKKEQKIIEEHVNSLIVKITIISGVIIILALIICFFFANSISKPLLSLVATIKEVDLDSLASTRITPKGASEIKELGGIFNDMAISLHDAVEELKETTSAKEKIEGELNVARDIQMSIIPKLFPAFPERPEFDVYATLRTAKAVGGDLYDFFFVDDDKLCFTIGDVSGKGVPASLFMAVTRTLLRAKTQPGMSAGEITTQINDALCQDNDQCMFVTMFLFIMDLKTGVLSYCNAGHNPVYIIKNQMTLSKLDAIHGAPLGAVDGKVYQDVEVTLKAGDTLVLYTDGVTEAHDTEQKMYGEERFEKLLEQSRMQSPKGLVDAINKDVDEFSGDAEQFDDITILALNYRGNVSK